MRLATILCTLLTTFAFAAPAQALIEELARYEFPTVNPNPVGPGYDSSTLHPDVFATPMTRISSTGLPQYAIENTSPAYATQPVLRVGPNSQTHAAAVTNQSFFQFSAGLNDPLSRLNLTSLQFDTARGGPSIERGFALYASLDGLSFNPLLVVDEIPGERPNFTNYDVDLISPAFENLNDPVTFRFYVFSPSSGATIEFDNIMLFGEVLPPPIIPEPSSLICLAGLISVAACRRRNKRRGSASRR